jgi:hypothetical protein
MELLALPKGPLLGVWTAAVMDWQLAHPQGSKPDCIAHIKASYEQSQAIAAGTAMHKQ